MINQSNCSESCFRMTGSLEDIKGEVTKMIDIWISEEEGGISIERAEELKELKERIENIKVLEEFDLLKFDFTTNYETYFQSKEGDLLVASCNNHEWDDLNAEFMDSDEYWSIRDGGRYLIAFEDDEYILAQKRKDDDDIGNFQVIDTICIKKNELTKLDVEMDNYDKTKTFRMFEKGGEHFIRNEGLNQIIKINEVKDKNVIRQIETLIMLGNDGKSYRRKK